MAKYKKDDDFESMMVDVQQLRRRILEATEDGLNIASEDMRDNMPVGPKLEDDHPHMVDTVVVTNNGTFKGEVVHGQYIAEGPHVLHQNKSHKTKSGYIEGSMDTLEATLRAKYAKIDLVTVK